jgi:hypothetical protein
MATTPTTTVRLTTAAAATLVAAVLAVDAIVATSRSIALPLTLTVLALAALVVGLALSRSAVIGAAIALLGLEFALSGHHPSDVATALYAAGLVLVAELAFWSHTAELLRATRARITRKAATILIVALGAALLAAVVAEGAHAAVSGAWLEPVGIVAAIAATLLLVLLARDTTATDG